VEKNKECATFDRNVGGDLRVDYKEQSVLRIQKGGKVTTDHLCGEDFVGPKKLQKKNEERKRRQGYPYRRGRKEEVWGAQLTIVWLRLLQGKGEGSMFVEKGYSPMQRKKGANKSD